MVEKKKKIRFIELFAWVWGFRLGLERADKKLFEIAWSNQWEPATKIQHASEIYVRRFWWDQHSNEDISKVPVMEIPDHDMIVGGFPCQDYSVAKSLKYSKWIVWKKWVLWWDIHRIINEKKSKPKYLLLENVDRLLKSPVSQRGRDFAIMLASLSDSGYIVEWRVINAADYGMPQRRRRVFFLAYHESTELYKRAKKLKDASDWILKDWVIAQEFSVSKTVMDSDEFTIDGELDEISSDFNSATPWKMPFHNSGIIIGRKVCTVKTVPEYTWKRTNLWDILLPDDQIPWEYFIKNEDISKWEYQKWWKHEKRTNKATWFEYNYSEWGMTFPDALDRPSRTIITGEWWTSASRFKHVVETKDWRKRRLTPIELERLNMFPDNHTEWVWDVKRAFFMWNALVVGIIEKLGKSLSKNI
jgi:DNA (cytosine-5)-methyltransferase 1